MGPNLYINIIISVNFPQLIKDHFLTLILYSKLKVSTIKLQYNDTNDLQTKDDLHHSNNKYLVNKS